MFLFKNPSVWFSFLETESMWGVQERLSEIVYSWTPGDSPHRVGSGSGIGPLDF